MIKKKKKIPSKCCNLESSRVVITLGSVLTPIFPLSAKIKKPANSNEQKDSNVTVMLIISLKMVC